MDELRLCEFCSAHDLDFLRGPTKEDLQNLRAGSYDPSLHPFKNQMGASELTKLGTVDRIRESAQTCGLCLLFIEILDEAGIPDILASKGARSEVCFSQLVNFVQFRRTDGDIMRYRTRRLGLVFGEQRGDRPATVYNCVQACEIGASRRDAERPFSGREGSQQLMFAGRKRPELVDMEWPRRWLRKCMQCHGVKCMPRASRASAKASVFRLIDVHAMCVRTFMDVDWVDQQYTALSYVWGAGQQMMLTTTNYAELEMSGSIDERCAQTIKDAALVTKELGVDFLWVDALCIVQDSEEDKKIQIENMATIYRSAVLTIVAAAGSNVNHGLPGLRSPRTKLQNEAVVELPGDGRPGFSLMKVLSTTESPSEQPLETVTWNRRGWTYQESVLSRRMLTFTEQQILWSCRQTQWEEEVDLEDDSVTVEYAYSTQHISVLDQGVESLTRLREDKYLSRLVKMFSEFNKRELSYEGDRPDAFAAVTEEYSDLSGQALLWGLPCFRFELALCWESIAEDKIVARRTAITTLPRTSLNRRVPIPSWTWMGWTGELLINCDDTDIELGMRPGVSAYVLRNRPLRLLKVSDIRSDNENYDPETAFWPIDSSTVTLKQVHDNVPFLTWMQLSETPDDQLILFWTEVAMFYSGYKNDKVFATSWRKVIDDSGTVVGELGRSSDGHESAAVEDITGPYEFILVAHSRGPVPPSRVLVLQIIRKNGIAYRVTSASIGEEAWMKAQRQRTLIALA